MIIVDLPKVEVFGGYYLNVIQTIKFIFNRVEKHWVKEF